MLQLYKLQTARHKKTNNPTATSEVPQHVQCPGHDSCTGGGQTTGPCPGHDSCTGDGQTTGPPLSPEPWTCPCPHPLKEPACRCPRCYPPPHGRSKGTCYFSLSCCSRSPNAALPNFSSGLFGPHQFLLI